MSVDPKAAETGVPYGYGADDPTTESDPTGESIPGCHTIDSPCGQLEKLLHGRHADAKGEAIF